MRFPKDWCVEHAEPLAQGVGGRIWRVRVAGATAIAKRLSPAARADADFATAWLRGQDGGGAVRLLDARGDWQLLEDAGDRTAADLLREDGDEAAAQVAAEVLRRLHAQHRSGAGLQPLAARLVALRETVQREGGLYLEAAEAAQGLLAEGGAARPLHGDLHHDNILFGSRGWLAIDPHGVFGDPAYDAADWLYNPLDRHDLRTDPARAGRLALILAPAVERPATAVLAWAFCHACLSASWHLEDGNHSEAALSLEVARAIRAALGPTLPRRPKAPQ